jgi:hypothetical protein
VVAWVPVREVAARHAAHKAADAARHEAGAQVVRAKAGALLEER